MTAAHIVVDRVATVLAETQQRLPQRFGYGHWLMLASAGRCSARHRKGFAFMERAIRPRAFVHCVDTHHWRGLDVAVVERCVELPISIKESIIIP